MAHWIQWLIGLGTCVQGCGHHAAAMHAGLQPTAHKDLSSKRRACHGGHGCSNSYQKQSRCQFHCHGEGGHNQLVHNPCCAQLSIPVWNQCPGLSGAGRKTFNCSIVQQQSVTPPGEDGIAVAWISQAVMVYIFKSINRYLWSVSSASWNGGQFQPRTCQEHMSCHCGPCSGMC